MKKQSLNLSKQTIRRLTDDETRRVVGGGKMDDPLKTRIGGCSGLCGSGGCTSLIVACPVTANCDSTK